MWADYHVHSEYSDDSTQKMTEQLDRALELGLDELCFTDHVDYGIKRDWDDPRGIVVKPGEPEKGIPPVPLANVDYPRYFAELSALQERYAGRIAVKKGLECGTQVITVAENEALVKKYADQLDFVLLSVHQVDNQEFWTGDFQRGRTQAQYNERYYREIYEVQRRFTGYSVLAHLDLIRRYDPQGDYPFPEVRDQVAEILSLAIRDGKGIEINTSSWHYGLADTTPAREILALYKDLGGRILTMGSDAHSTRYVGDHFADAAAILRGIGFTQYCTFDHREPVFHEL